MKKLNALFAIVMMAVVPAVQAHAQVVSVESAMDQLNFALTVQWDQKDAAFKKQAIDQFTAQINALQESGVSQEKILSALQAKMPDAQTAKDVQDLAAVAKAKNLSAAETNKLVMDYVAKAQTSGASWSDGGAAAIVIISVLLIVTVIVLASDGRSSVGVVYYDDCYYGGYYDYYGNYYCY